MAKFWVALGNFFDRLFNAFCEDGKVSLGRLGLWVFLIPTFRLLWFIPTDRTYSISASAIVLITIGLIIFCAYNFAKKDEFFKILDTMVGKLPSLSEDEVHEPEVNNAGTDSKDS